MFRPLALILCLAAPTFGFWEKGYRVRFDGNMAGLGVTAFIEMPQSIKEAYERGWEKVQRPHGPAGYEKLVMWCPKHDYTLCILFDDTGYIAGSQIAFNPEKFEGAIYNWTAGGFTKWNVIVDGVLTQFWTTQQYYISNKALATDPVIRLASRDAERLYQEDNLYVSGFNGEIFSVPTDHSKLKTSNVYTPQACIPMMGKHYYYNMTRSLPCSVDTVFPWFPMEHNDQVIGLGFLWPGKYATEEGKLFPFEESIRPAIQMIVPNGPDCLHEHGDNLGAISMHTYFIKEPHRMSCA